MDDCLALADLGASINLMPLFVWEALLLSKLTPTCMTLELADRSVSKPIVPTTSPTPAPVKAFEPNYVTYGGAHSYQNCPATSENVYRDNIQDGVAYQRPTIPTPSKVVKQGTEVTKDQVQTPSSQSTAPVQPSVVQSETQTPVSEPVVAPVSDLMPNLKPSILYPSRRDNERRRDQANEQIEKFYEIFKDMIFEISFTDVLTLMPKFASTLKALIGNKEKLSEMARTPTNEHCLAVILNKLPRKLRDPGKFLIPCEFQGMDECLALADLGASINLMPLSLWEGLSLPELTPTCMTLELADRSVSKPIGIAKDVSVKFDVFHFPADFVVVDFKPDPRVPLILRRCFLKTGRALIDVHKGELTLRIGNKAITYNLDQTVRYSANYNQMTANKIDVIDMACEEYSQEVLGFSNVTASGNPTPYDDLIISTTSPTLTPFGDSDFLLVEEADAFLGLEDDPNSSEFNPFYYDPEGDILLLEAILNSEPLPPLPNHEQYMPSFRKNSRFMKPKMLNLPLMNLLSPWVSPVHYVPKKGGFTIVENEENELIPTRLVTGCRVCIDYRKLNEATRKDHFPLPFMDQMLERLAGNEYYCFLDGFSGYFQIPIGLHDQDKSTFTCPYGTFAYSRMPFGLCNAPGMFQRCMLAIFYDMVEKTMEVFMDNFLVFGNSFKNYLSHLDKMLQRIEVDKAKVDVIAKLPHPTTVKAPILIALNWDLPFELMCDSSDFAIGAVLGQQHEKHFKPIHYASKMMNDTESNYTTTKKEMLAVVYAFEKFRSYLIMNKSIVHTDHSALKYLFAKKDVKARLLRWVLLLQEFDFKVLDTKGAENLAADHLSRLENPYEDETDTQEKDKNKAKNDKTKHGIEKIEKDKVIRSQKSKVKARGVKVWRLGNNGPWGVLGLTVLVLVGGAPVSVGLVVRGDGKGNGRDGTSSGDESKATCLVMHASIDADMGGSGLTVFCALRRRIWENGILIGDPGACVGSSASNASVSPAERTRSPIGTVEESAGAECSSSSSSSSRSSSLVSSSSSSSEGSSLPSPPSAG
nr:reverse transcriptase domain-containing protein [Tanacetum cinerariifolium]